MKEWITGFFDFTKLPTKILAVVAVVSATIMFTPAWFQAKLHLEPIIAKYGGFIGMALLFSVCLVGVNAFLWVCRRLAQFFKHLSWLRQVPIFVANLDHTEKAVLREFRIREVHVVELPADSPAVIGLMKKGLVHPVSSSGIQTLAGIIVPFKLDSRVDPLLTRRVLGVPEGKLTPEEEQQLYDSRPTWVRELEHQNYLRGR